MPINDENPKNMINLISLFIPMKTVFWYKIFRKILVSINFGFDNTVTKGKIDNTPKVSSNEVIKTTKNKKIKLFFS